MPNFASIPLESHQLHSVWPFIRRGLEAIIKKTRQHGGSPDCLPEDVFTTLRTGNAQLLFSCVDDITIGFIIFYYTQAPFSGKKELFIWHTYTIPPAERPNALDVNGAVASTMARVKQIAHEQGCSVIRAVSSRPGMELWLTKFGFNLVHSVYEIPL